MNIRNDLDTNDLNFFPLVCRYFNGNSFEIGDMPRREVYDYEVEYYIKSKGGIELNNVFVPFEKGSVNFRSPGQIVRGIPPYECITICIDIAGNKEKQKNYQGCGNYENRQPQYCNPILNRIPFKLPADKNKNIEKIIMQIYKNYLLHTNESNLLLKSALYSLFAEMHKAAKGKDDLTPDENLHVQKAIRYIKDMFKENIKIGDVAETLGLSTNYFQKIFKETTGISPKNYINELRIEEAKYLLTVTNIKIEQIGEKCGFFDHVYFSYVFKQRTGVTAREYRYMQSST